MRRKPKDAFDESALIQHAKIDSEAFGILYERYVDRIYKYVYYRTGNVADAEPDNVAVGMLSAEFRHPMCDFGEKVGGGQFTVILVDFNHDLLCAPGLSVFFVSVESQ